MISDLLNLIPGERRAASADAMEALANLPHPNNEAFQEILQGCRCGIPNGNAHWSAGIYGEAAKMMREIYPDVITYIGAVEGYPGLEDVSRYLKHAQGGSIVLKPFMIVAGDHAVNDMAGEDENSWKTVLTRQGFNVIPVLKGLGSNDEFARLFVAHIQDAARDADIDLK